VGWGVEGCRRHWGLRRCLCEGEREGRLGGEEQTCANWDEKLEIGRFDGKFNRRFNDCCSSYGWISLLLLQGLKHLFTNESYLDSSDGQWETFRYLFAATMTCSS